ncbi:MAG: hypothetical protein AAFY11_14075, partial [Cyanobacteria bacterium J06641_5]
RAKDFKVWERLEKGRREKAESGGYAAPTAVAWQSAATSFINSQIAISARGVKSSGLSARTVTIS